MDIDWGTVVIGFVCTCIGLWAGWGIYRGKVEALKLEIKALKRALSDERGRGEAYGKAADEWRGAAMRADAEVERLKREKDTEIAGLKQKLDDVQARLYAESVDTWIRERRLQRALWVTRASEAVKEVNYWTCENGSSYAIVDFNVHHETIVSYKAPHHRPYKWIMIWENVERRCRAKAEEYK